MLVDDSLVDRIIKVCNKLIKDHTRRSWTRNNTKSAVINIDKV